MTLKRRVLMLMSNQRTKSAARGAITLISVCLWLSGSAVAEESKDLELFSAMLGTSMLETINREEARHCPSSLVGSERVSPLTLFCTDPEKYICGFNGKEMDAFLQGKDTEDLRTLSDLMDQFAKLKGRAPSVNEKEFEKSKQLALRAVAVDLGVDPETLTLEMLPRLFFPPAISDLPEDEQKKAMEKGRGLVAKYVNAFIKAAKGVVHRREGKIPETYKHSRKVFEDVRADVKRTVAAAVPEAKRKGILDRLKKTKLLTPEDFVQAPEKVLNPSDGTYEIRKNTAATVNPEAEKYAEVYGMACGFFDMSKPHKQAFYIKSDNVIIVCPGFLVNSVLSGGYEGDDPALGAVLAHELGHATFHDPVYLKEGYKHPELVNCIHKHASGELDPATSRRYEPVRVTEIVQDHANEIAADLYAVEYMAGKLEGMGADIMGKLRVLRNAYSYDCDPSPFTDGIHPPGGYRITQIMRRNPRIHKAMGCESRTRPPQYGCTLRGRTDEKY